MKPRPFLLKQRISSNSSPAMALFSIATILSTPLHAADVTWDTATGDSAVTGGAGTWDTTNSNWTVDAGANNISWVNGTDRALFGVTGGAVTLGADVTVSGLSFTSNGYSIAPGSGPFKITLSAAGSTGSATSGSIYTSTGTTTISADIDNGGFLLSRVGPGSAILSGNISGAGGLTTVYGGTTTLSGNNTYTGKTSISANTTSGSTVSVSSLNSVNGGTPLMASSSLGAPTTVANGTIDIGNSGKRASSTLIYTGTGETTDRVINVLFNSSSSQTIRADNASGLLKFTSAMTSNGGTQTGKLILRGTGAGEIVQDLPKLATGGLEKLDAGTWTVGGANTGNVNVINVANGTLLVNGTMNVTTTVTVSNGATLGGTGIIGGTASISGGGTLSPGESPGTLTFSDDLSLLANSIYAFEGGDLTDVGGTLTLTDNWTLALGAGLQDGGSVTIFEYGIAGSFDLAPTFDISNLGFSPSGPLSLTDTGNAIVLNGVSAIPEPGGLVLFGLGAAMTGLLRRRRTVKF